MSRARSQNKVCGCAQGDLCLSPPGPLGWRVGGLFTFNLAMKLTPGAWERNESFQLGGLAGYQSLAKVLESRADRDPLSTDGKTALSLPGSHITIPPVCDRTAHPRRIPRFHSKGRWADSHTETRALTWPSSSQPRGATRPLSLPNPTACWTPGPPLSFHFCSSAPRRPEAPGLCNCQPPPETLGDLELPGSTQGKPLSSETTCPLVL